MRRILAALIILISFASLTHAQDEDDTRVLDPGIPVSGVIDAQHLSQTYYFVSDGGENETTQLQNQGVIPLAMSVVDSAGNPVAHSDPTNGGTDAGVSWTVSAPGTYYVLIFSPQAPGDHQAPFTVTRVAPPTLDQAGALQFELAWTDGANLSLEVRDPQGQSLHLHSTQTDDGGAFAGDTAPVDCKTFQPHNQTQTATWQAAVPGSYEILVHDLNSCVDQVPFNLNVTLGGQSFPSITGTAQTGQTFAAGLITQADGSAAFRDTSGMVSDTPSLTIRTADLVAHALPLPPTGIVKERLTNDQPYRSYSFTGQLGDVITATAQRVSGSLDTVLALLDTNGNLLALNDDAAEGTTDSLIPNTRLRHSGTYLIVVTRYGQALGATEGDFVLTVTGTGN